MDASSHAVVPVRMIRATEALRQFKLGDRVLVTVGDQTPPTIGQVHATMAHAVTGEAATAYVMVVPDGTAEPCTVTAQKLADGQQHIGWRPVVVEDHARPQAGDVVRLDGPWEWADTQVKPGDLGVIEGVVGETAVDEPLVTFHASTFRSDNIVSCSGGPATYIPVEELEFTGEHTTITAWRWRNGRAAAHNGRSYQVEVPVWSWRGRVER